MNRSQRLNPISDKRGSAAIEFAVILPLLSILLFGFFEVGRMFYTYNIASAAARDAARFAARLPMTCVGLTPADETRVKTLAVTGDAKTGRAVLIKGLSTANVSLAYGCVANSTPKTYAGVYENVLGVPTVTVTVNAPFRTVFQSLLPSLTVNGLTASHSESWTE